MLRFYLLQAYILSVHMEHECVIRAVRRRRRAAAADRMSASRRRRFRDVFTSCCKPAICC